jgi:hypothetical protein
MNRGLIQSLLKRLTLLLLALFVALCAVLLSGCGRLTEAFFRDREGYGGVYEEKDVLTKADDGVSEPAAAPLKSEAKMAKERVSDVAGTVEGEREASTASGETTARPEKPEERKRIYSGYAKLLVGDVEEQKKRIATIAEESGGYVESMYESSVLIRVPSERFQAIFSQILDLGEILHRSVETMDVTEYFQDLSSRLEIAKTTRERLYKLLEKTWDVEERLRILREIRRLTEEIERIGLTLTLLERQVAFSRISVDLVPRLAQESATRDKIPFRWIADLDPLYPTLDPVKGRIELELSDDFAVFEEKLTILETLLQRGSLFRAESFEGTRVRVGSAENRPKGDSVFWQEALSYHLSRYYRRSEKMSLGDLESILFTSKDREPFSYLVGVLVKDRRLVIVEVFFPNQKALDDRLGQIKSALVEFEVK